MGTERLGRVGLWTGRSTVRDWKTDCRTQEIVLVVLSDLALVARVVEPGHHPPPAALWPGEDLGHSWRL